MLKLTLPARQMAASTPGRRIVIIGGGFTGASIARLLAQRSPGHQDTITILEPRRQLGSGVAYDTDGADLRLNVAAHRMRALPGNPGAFLAWLTRTGRLDADPDALQDGMVYARRSDFAAFMSEQLAPYLDSRRILHIRRKAIAIRRERGLWHVRDSCGQVHLADVVVIATSPATPASPVAAREEQDRGHAAGALPLSRLETIEPNQSVIIAGSGLTAMDMLATLAARGHHAPITLVSRTGLLPCRQPDGDFTPHGDALFGTHRSAVALVQAIRRAVRTVTAGGLPWQSVMDALRHEAPRLWAGLAPQERARIRRHAWRLYEVHRNRMTPVMAGLVETMIAQGRLRVVKGRIASVGSDTGEIEISFTGPGKTFRETIGQHDAHSIRADHLLLATGPDHARVIDHHDYLQDLHASGLIMPDPYGLGLACDEDSHALARDGHPVSNLFVAGPLARGTFGELSGVPEIAAQAEQIARQILASKVRRSRTLFIRSLSSRQPVLRVRP